MKRPGPSWQVSIVVMVVGVLLGVPLVVRAVSSVAQVVTAPMRMAPVNFVAQLDGGQYVVFERVGTRSSVGPVERSDRRSPSLSPASVVVRRASGEVVPTRPDFSVDTFTRGQAILA